MTVAGTFRRYAQLVSPSKRGARWEVFRIEHFCRDFPKLASRQLRDAKTPDFAAWRDKRLQQVSPSSVVREMNLFSNIFSIARDEWKWISDGPLKGVRRPKDAKPRERRITEDEETRLLYALGYQEDELPLSISARVGIAFQFAIETAMRAGEIVGLTWNQVHIEQRYVRLDQTKNGFGRSVPLSNRAIELIKKLEPIT